MLLAGLLAGVAVLALDGRGPGALGFHLAPVAGRELAAGFGVGTVVGLAVVAGMLALGGVRFTGQEGSLLGWLSGGLGALAFLALPAAAEEAVLRGYPLQALAEAWGPAWALGITSIAFGGLHLANPEVTALALANVSAAGLLLGVVYLKTASLWWATGAHLGWNWAHGWVADVPVSGLELMDAPFYEGVPSGPAWLGGGGFGPEGSAVATVVVLVASALLWRSDLLRPSDAARRAEPLVLAAESHA
jgi:membrane protease YdiL (CAAX protease family)